MSPHERAWPTSRRGRGPPGPSARPRWLWSRCWPALPPQRPCQVLAHDAGTSTGQWPAHAADTSTRACTCCVVTSTCLECKYCICWVGNFSLEKHSQHLFACVEDSMSVITTRKPVLSCRDSVSGMDRCQVNLSSRGVGVILVFII